MPQPGVAMAVSGRRTKAMTVADFEKSLAALLAWREERPNGTNGMLGVLFVVRNRVKAGWNQGSWSRVIEAHNQFTSITMVGDPGTVTFPDPREPQFLQILQLVDSVYDNTRLDNLTDGALYYYDPGPGVTPGGWFEREIIGKPDIHPRCAKIGSTVYFK